MLSEGIENILILLIYVTNRNNFSDYEAMAYVDIDERKTK